MANKILMTGATGLLGRYLLRDLLEAGAELVILARSSRGRSAADRVASIVTHWEQDLGHPLTSPTVIDGDLTAPLLGLNQDALRLVERECDLLLNNAASLTFHSTSPDGEPFRSNVGGTQHVLDLCQQTGIRDLHHVSTAYVCGLRTGTVLETELDVDQECGNDYERSKIKAELMIRSSDFLAPPTIYRPSIIIGDSRSGFTTTFHGFYATLKLVWTLIQSDEFRRHEPGTNGTRLNLDGDEHKNFVPVDWVSAVIASIVVNKQQHGKTYHLTIDDPPNTRMIVDVLERVGGFRGTVFAGANKPILNPTMIEKLFYENMMVYESYWRNDPHFDKSNTLKAVPHLHEPKVDQETLVRLSKAAVEMGFRWREPRAAKLNLASK